MEMYENTSLSRFLRVKRKIQEKNVSKTCIYPVNTGKLVKNA